MSAQVQPARAETGADTHRVEGDAAQAAAVVRSHRQPGQDRAAHRQRHARARHQRPVHPIAGGVGAVGIARTRHHQVGWHCARSGPAGVARRSLGRAVLHNDAVARRHEGRIVGGSGIGGLPQHHPCFGPGIGVGLRRHARSRCHRPQAAATHNGTGRRYPDVCCHLPAQSRCSRSVSSRQTKVPIFVQFHPLGQSGSGVGVGGGGLLPASIWLRTLVVMV